MNKNDIRLLTCNNLYISPRPCVILCIELTFFLVSFFLARFWGYRFCLWGRVESRRLHTMIFIDLISRQNWWESSQEVWGHFLTLIYIKLRAILTKQPVTIFTGNQKEPIESQSKLMQTTKSAVTERKKCLWILIERIGGSKPPTSHTPLSRYKWNIPRFWGKNKRRKKDDLVRNKILHTDSLLRPGLVAQSLEQRWTESEVAGSIFTQVRVFFFCPCVTHKIDIRVYVTALFPLITDYSI